MPVVTVDWWTGNSETARAEAVRGITDALVAAAGCPREAVTVIIRDTDPGYWGSGGTLASDSRTDRPR
ncbi:tautomerase family protein [Actinokineospora enzanensis]|uniref:tautomerase family protein n=1 Tax=Actinokineospora enzanensis TaxID=155975 RepID=UPI000380801C|nr:4-oxalocrotonate tautomerase family protein [Actinokineospora enzanensis]